MCMFFRAPIATITQSLSFDSYSVKQIMKIPLNFPFQSDHSPFYI